MQTLSDVTRLDLGAVSALSSHCCLYGDTALQRRCALGTVDRRSCSWQRVAAASAASHCDHVVLLRLVCVAPSHHQCGGTSSATTTGIARLIYRTWPRLHTSDSVSSWAAHSISDTARAPPHRVEHAVLGTAHSLRSQKLLMHSAPTPDIASVIEGPAVFYLWSTPAAS